MGFPDKTESLENRELANEAKPFRSTTAQFTPPPPPPFTRPPPPAGINIKGGDLDDMLMSMQSRKRCLRFNGLYNFLGRAKQSNDDVRGKPTPPKRSEATQLTAKEVAKISNQEDCATLSAEKLQAPIDD